MSNAGENGGPHQLRSAFLMGKRIPALAGQTRPAGGAPLHRKLTAILLADVVGYSRLMGRDEEGTHARFIAMRGELLEPAIAAHEGTIIKRTGDGVLA